jgi:hypothetical protein
MRGKESGMLQRKLAPLQSEQKNSQFFEKTSRPLLLFICALSEELLEATWSYSL